MQFQNAEGLSLLLNISGEIVLKKNRSLVIVGSTSIMLLASFQNCAKTTFSSSSVAPSTATTTAGGGSNITTTSTGGTTTSGEPGDDTYCLNALQGLPGGATSAVPTITYDSMPVSNAAPVSYMNFITLPAINSPNIQTITNGVSNKINVTAASINQIANIASEHIVVNAQSLGSLTTFTSETVTVVTHTLGNVGLFASGQLCVSAQSIANLNGLSAASSFWGRNENSQLATIGSLGQLSAFINFHYFAITKISDVSLNMRLSNSHLGTLQGASGTLYLQDSVIDTVQNFAGIIHLKGSSSITSLKDNATIVIHD